MNEINNIPFQLVDYTGKVIATGAMPWYYVQPRILKYEDKYYVLLSDVYSPGPGTAEKPNRYILVGTEDRISQVPQDFIEKV